MFEEQWCPITWIPEYVNMYSVSSWGNVRSEYRPKFRETGEFMYWFPGRPLIPFYSHRYHAVKFTNGGLERTFLVHRLVAKAFIPVPERYLQMGYTMDTLEVNHISGNPTENTIWNLEWCTKEENMQHAVRIGLIPPGKRGKDHFRSIPVAMYDLNGNLVATFESISDASRFFDGSHATADQISAVCRGERYTSRCHIFRYINKGEAVETKISVPELP